MTECAATAHPYKIMLCLLILINLLTIVVFIKTKIVVLIVVDLITILVLKQQQINQKKQHPPQTTNYPEEDIDEDTLKFMRNFDFSSYDKKHE